MSYILIKMSHYQNKEWGLKESNCRLNSFEAFEFLSIECLFLWLNVEI